MEQSSSNPRFARVGAASGRSWARFSLRSLLVFATLVCLALGVLAERGRRHRRAIAIVEGVYGEVTYNDQASWWERAFRRPVKALKFGWPHPNQSLDDFEFLRDVPEIESLWIGHQAAFGDDDLAMLAELPNLRRLSVVYCSVTADGLRPLRGSGLESLQIGPLAEYYERRDVTDAEFESFALPGLKRLRIVFPHGHLVLTDEQKQMLKRIAPACSVEFSSPFDVKNP